MKPTRTSVTILGATGSIGKSTLDLITRAPGNFDVIALVANKNVTELSRAAIQTNAKLAVIADNAHYGALKDALSGHDTEVAAGPDAVIEAAKRDADCIVAGIVGAAGLKPTFAALEQGTRIGLANKECLVCAGHAFTQKAAHHGTAIIPVDSEHSAAFQALQGSNPDAIEKITLTASGGPFRDWTPDQLAAATREQALSHPNWDMGNKVTIDSATMMNKGLELIEAFHLFPVTAKQLDAVVHPQSIVHCLVSYCDGSVLAQLAEPDMRIPISLALAWPERLETPTKRLNLTQLGTLTFERPDENRFPAFRLARQALKKGGSAPTVLNAANEAAVEAFLKGRVRFTAIPELVEEALECAEKTITSGKAPTIDDALEIDAKTREFTQASILTMC